MKNTNKKPICKKPVDIENILNNPVSPQNIKKQFPKETFLDWMGYLFYSCFLSCVGFFIYRISICP